MKMHLNEPFWAESNIGNLYTVNVSIVGPYSGPLWVSFAVKKIKNKKIEKLLNHLLSNIK